MERYRLIASLTSIYHNASHAKSIQKDVVDELHDVFKGYVSLGLGNIQFDIDSSNEDELRFDGISILPSLTMGFKIRTPDEYVLHPNQLLALTGWLSQEVKV